VPIEICETPPVSTHRRRHGPPAAHPGRAGRATRRPRRRTRLTDTRGRAIGPLVWNAGGVTVYRIRFEGPAALAMGVATALADADGVDLTSSKQPSILDKNTVELSVSVEGNRDAVARAVATIRDELPDGASIEIADD
jgi:hypothetical protein